MRPLKIIILFVLLYQSQFGWNQDIKFGVLMGTNLYQNTKVDTAIYSPINSYNTYIENEEGKGIIHKHIIFNSINTGLIFNFSFKRMTFNIEPQYYYQRTTFRFDNPYPTERVIGKRAFRIPIYATYKFFKNENSIYGLAGLIFNAEKVWDFQAPGFGYYIGPDSLYQDNFYFGDDHFEGVLYDDHKYWNYMVGIGKKINRFNYSFRYVNQLNITKHDILAKTWQIEFSVNILLLSYSDFTKKHFLYVD